VKWKITVTTSGGIIKDFVIADTLPISLNYSGYTVVQPLPNGLTLS
jgi:hypothetical protein